MGAVSANASNLELAGTLSEINSEMKGQGTLASIMLRKKGVERGPSTARVVYGDDFIHTLIWTGFHYSSLVERSFKRLHFLWAQGDILHKLAQATEDAGYSAVTVQDVAEAIQEVDDSFLRILHGIKPRAEAEADADSTTSTAPDSRDDFPNSSVWEPLKVNGEVVPGSKVYIGVGDLLNPRAPVKGTVYIDGVKLGEKLLTPAPNGAWMPKRKPKAVAKDILRSWLPVGLYVRYCLEPENLLLIKIGQEAGEHAKAEGVPVDPLAVRSLFKIA